jgi:hypothetical protein
MSEELRESTHRSSPLTLFSIEEHEVSGPSDRWYCLKLLEASSYGIVCENHQHRRAELNVGVHNPAARIEFLVAGWPNSRLSPCEIFMSIAFSRFPEFLIVLKKFSDYRLP